MKSKEANLTHLLLNDSIRLTQEIWFGFGGIPLFKENIDRLEEHLQVFNIEIPEFLKNRRELFRITKRMLNKNKLYRSGIVKIQLFEIDKAIDYVITCQPFTESGFPISNEGILTDIANFEKNTRQVLSKYSFINEIIWRKENSELINTPLKNAILLNDKQAICEAIGSNIFFIQDKKLFTPSLESGCYVDIMREYVFQAASQIGLEVIESDKIVPKQLFEMNEIFIAAEAKGIQRVLGFKNKRYVHKTTYLIHQKLNDILKEKVD